MRRKVFVAIAGVLVLAVGLAIVALRAGDQTSGRQVHDDEEGPLSASAGWGGFTMAEPAGLRAPSWAGTFGGFVLCVHEGTSPIVLERYRPHALAEPAEVYAGIRTITPAETVNAAGREDDRGMIQGSAWGTPLRFAEPYANGPALRGSYERGVAGVTVTQPCKQALDFGPKSAESLRELMVTVITDTGDGAFVDYIDLDYRVGNREYTLRMKWELGLCGQALDDIRPEDCDA